MKMAASYNAQITELEVKIRDLEANQATERMQEVEEDAVVTEVEKYFLMTEYDSEILNHVIDAIYVSNDGKIEIDFKRDDFLKEVGIA